MIFGPISIWRDLGGRRVLLRIGRLDILTWWKSQKREARVVHRGRLIRRILD